MTLELKCHHKYHTHCLAGWLIEQKTCPNCRNNEELLYRVHWPSHTIEYYDILHFIILCLFLLNLACALLSLLFYFTLPERVIEKDLRGPIDGIHLVVLMGSFTIALCLEFDASTEYQKFGNINTILGDYIYRVCRASRVMLISSFIQLTSLTLTMSSVTCPQTIDIIILSLLICIEGLCHWFLVRDKIQVRSKWHTTVLYDVKMNQMDQQD